MSVPSSPNDAIASGSSSPIISARRPSGPSTRMRPANAPIGPRKPTSRSTLVASPPPTARQFASITQVQTVERPSSRSQAHPDDPSLQALPPLPTSPPPAGNSRPQSYNSRPTTPGATLSSPAATSSFPHSPTLSRPPASSPTASPRVSSPVSENLHSPGTSLPYLQPESKPPTPPLTTEPPPSVVERVQASPTRVALPLPPVGDSDRQLSVPAQAPSPAPFHPSAPESSPASTSSLEPVSAPTSSSAPVPPSSPAPPRSVATPIPSTPLNIISFAAALAPSPFRKKTLTLSAAQWTLTSTDLQGIVSRAIRSSAEPSSIRLLPLDVLDNELAEEEKRLENERLEAMGKYRLGAHRRTMLLRSLNAIQSLGGGEAAENLSSLSALVASLDETTEALVRTSAQLAEHRSLRDVHAASALSVALRKLNASFARRQRELGTLKEKLEQVQAERDEAWRVAEDLANEMDERAEWEDLEGEEFEDLTEEVVNGQRGVTAAATLTRVSRIGVKLRVPGVGPRVVIPSNRSPIKRRPSPLSMVSTGDQDPDSGDALKSPTSAHPPLTPPPIEPLPPPPPPIDSEDQQEQQPKTRQRSNSAASRVSAARKRSIRQSKASLRIPRDLLNNANASTSGTSGRPKSSYSQRSTRSQGSLHSRTRSRSQARIGTGSTPSSPVDGIDKHPPLPIPSTLSPSTMSPSSASPQTASSEQIPEVPKIPTALLNLRTPVPRPQLPPMPPLPPMPAEPAPTSALGNGSSFLDMITRPSSRTGSASETAGRTPIEMTGEGLEKMRKSLEEVARSADEVGTAGMSHPDNKGEANQKEGVVEMPDDGSHGVMGPTTSPSLPNPFSPASATPSIASAHFDTPSTPSRSLQIRHPLSQRPRDRPPPDSPVDVAHSRSGPGFPDGDVDDDDELVDSFADAYAYEYGTVRTMRFQQTQSMLAFPTMRNVSDSDVASHSARGRTLNHVASFAGPSSSSAEVFFTSPVKTTSSSSEKRTSKSPLSPAYKEAYPFARPMSDGPVNGSVSTSQTDSPQSPHPGTVLQSAPVDVTTFDIRNSAKVKRPTSMPLSVMTSSSSENERPWGYF